MTGAPVPNSLRLVLIFFFGSVFLAALHLGHLPDPKPMALAMGGAFALALLRLRHVALALATVIAPLPGILLFGPSAYALSLAASLLMAANYADARLQDQNGLAALFRPVPALVITVIFAFGWALHAPVRQESLTAASLCVIFFLPGFALASGFNENAIARGNRFREIQLRFFSLAAGMAQPRWCIALSGAGLVQPPSASIKTPVAADVRRLKLHFCFPLSAF